MSSSTSESQACSVRVILRFKPNSDLAQPPIYSFPSLKTVVMNNRDVDGHREQFSFDIVLYPSATQQQAYSSSCGDIVEDVLCGRNVSFISYGQTGAGKTFTMIGGAGQDEGGIIPSAIASVLNALYQQQNASYTVKLSFLEVYMEDVYDLLAAKGFSSSATTTSSSSSAFACDDKKGTRLKLRETVDDGVVAEGLQQLEISCLSDALELIRLGDARRSTACTDMNSVSSRSHAVITVVVEQTFPDGAVRRSKINFADLAGSERVHRSNACGVNLEEAKTINKSLSCLGHCMHALSQSSRKHVPFRDSSLTFLLRESLGGNSKTTMIAACSSAAADADETMSTLRFAQRCKKISNEVIVNTRVTRQQLEKMVEFMKGRTQALEEYVHGLEQELQMLRARRRSSRGGTCADRSCHNNNHSTTNNNSVSRLQITPQACDHSFASDAELVALDFHSPIPPSTSRPTGTPSSSSSLAFVSSAIDILQAVSLQDAAVKTALQLLQKGLLGQHQQQQQQQQQQQNENYSEDCASAAATPPPLQLRVSAEFITLANHEKDAAAAAAAAGCGVGMAVGDSSHDCIGCSDDEAEALDQLQAYNERKRESLQMSIAPNDDVTVDNAHGDDDGDGDGDALPCTIEMHQRTKGLFKRWKRRYFTISSSSSSFSSLRCFNQHPLNLATCSTTTEQSLQSQTPKYSISLSSTFAGVRMGILVLKSMSAEGKYNVSLLRPVAACQAHQVLHLLLNKGCAPLLDSDDAFSAIPF